MSVGCGVLVVALCHCLVSTLLSEGKLVITISKLRYSLLAACAAMVSADNSLGQTVEWTRQWGTGSSDYSYGVSADALGNVFVSGFTQSSLGGPHSGETDAFVSAFSSLGELKWHRQIGTPAGEVSRGLAVDGLGNVYVGGDSPGAVAGPSAGSTDVFIRKYDSSGDSAWTRQLGSASYDECWSVAADMLGNVFVGGRTGGSLASANLGGNDAFVAKYDSVGNLQWTHQFGTSGSENALGLTADGLGHVYVSGLTNGNLGGPNAGGYDIFLRKLDNDGTTVWSQQFGTSGDDIGNSVSADALGNVFVGGRTTGNLGGVLVGDRDAFVAKYDASGNLAWTRQLGSSAFEENMSVSADGLGSVYFSGRTNGALDGVSSNQTDAYVGGYSSSGDLFWLEHIVYAGDQYAHGVSADGLGNVYLSGPTNQSVGGPWAGNYDAYLFKFSLVPEPGSAVLCALAIALIMTVGRTGWSPLPARS
jgi:hypothetical protein